MNESASGSGSNWNLPNVLTGLRIVMVPFFGWALLHDGGDSLLWRTVAFVLFVGAMITDKIDGDIARARNLVTNFGKIADPIADKAITGMAFIGLSVVGDIWWWVTAVVLLREWSVTLLRLSILKQVVVAAAQSGKVKTVLQAIALSTLCLPLRQVTGEPWETLGTVLFYAAQVLLAGAVAMTIWSGYEFFRDVWRQRRQHAPVGRSLTVACAGPPCSGGAGRSRRSAAQPTLFSLSKNELVVPVAGTEMSNLVGPLAPAGTVNVTVALPISSTRRRVGPVDRLRWRSPLRRTRPRPCRPRSRCG